MNQLRRVLVALLPILAAACAGGQAQTGTVGTPRANSAPARGGANLILAEELAASAAENALQAIKLLRPSMLRARGGSASDPTGASDIVVYQDGVKTGGPNSLELVATISVREIRFINAADATNRFGTGHPVGAILVTMKR